MDLEREVADLRGRLDAVRRHVHSAGKLWVAYEIASPESREEMLAAYELAEAFGAMSRDLDALADVPGKMAIALVSERCDEVSPILGDGGTHLACSLPRGHHGEHVGATANEWGKWWRAGPGIDRAERVSRPTLAELVSWDRCDHSGIGKPGCPTCDMDATRIDARRNHLAKTGDMDWCGVVAGKWVCGLACNHLGPHQDPDTGTRWVESEPEAPVDMERIMRVKRAGCAAVDQAGNQEFADQCPADDRALVQMAMGRLVATDEDVAAFEGLDAVVSRHARVISWLVRRVVAAGARS